jgi:hypothetical protein
MSIRRLVTLPFIILLWNGMGRDCSEIRIYRAASNANKKYTQALAKHAHPLDCELLFDVGYVLSSPLSRVFCLTRRGKEIADCLVL